MKKLKLIVLTSLIAVLSLLVLTACNRNGGDAGAADFDPDVDFRADVPAALRMSWWGSDARHEGIIAAVRHFMSENPHITVEYAPGGWDGYHHSLTIQLFAGDAPDLFSFGAGYRVLYGIGGHLIDYADYMHLFPFLEERRAILETSVYTVGGRIIGVPAGIDAQILAFSKTLFDRAGVPHPTDDMAAQDLLDLVEEAALALGPGYFWNGGWYWGPGWESLGAMGQPPDWVDFTDIETQPPTLNLDMDIHRRTWARVEQMWDNGTLPRAGDEEVGFAVGNTLMYYTRTPRATSEATEHELGFVVPARRWAAGDPVYAGMPGPGLFWGVSSTSDHILQALFLLEFIQTNPTAVEHIGFLVGQPTNPGSLAHLMTTLEPGSYEYIHLDIARRFREDVDMYIDRPTFAGAPEATQAFEQVFEEFIFGVIDLEEFLVRSISDVEAAFEEFFIPQEEVIAAMQDD